MKPGAIQNFGFLILSLALSIIIVLSLMPSNVYAEENDASEEIIVAEENDIADEIIAADENDVSDEIVVSDSVSAEPDNEALSGTNGSDYVEYHSCNKITVHSGCSFYSRPSTQSSAGSYIVADIWRPYQTFPVTTDALVYNDITASWWYHATMDDGTAGYVNAVDLWDWNEFDDTLSVSGNISSYTHGKAVEKVLTFSYEKISIDRIYVNIYRIGASEETLIDSYTAYDARYDIDEGKVTLSAERLNSLSAGEYRIDFEIDQDNYLYDGMFKDQIRDSYDMAFTVSDSTPTSTLVISPTKTKYTIKRGNPCSIGGTITSNNNITRVTGKLDGTTYTDFKPNSKSVNIGDTSKLNSFKSANLSVGTHKIVITATDGVKTVSKTITIEVTANTYIVKYNANGGTGAPAAQTKTEGQPLTLSNTIPTRTGWTFIGWSAYSNGSVGFYPGDTYERDQGITLYARWQAPGDVLINETNFPDVNFQSYVYCELDENGDNILTKEEISAVTELNLNHDEHPPFTSLKGIEYFTSLEYLELSESALTSLDLSDNVALKTLVCTGCDLQYLNVAGCANLETLDCHDCGLTSLDAFYNEKLTDLDCSDNQITYLSLSDNPDLIRLDCSNNQITWLYVRYATDLVSVDCSGNQLSTINVSNNKALTSLSCGSNQLTSIDLSNNTALTLLSCGSNQLTSIDLSNNIALTELYCSGNQLTSLDLSNNPELQTLHCSHNQLTFLDTTNNKKISELNSTFNQLTSLKVGSFYTLYCYGNNISDLDLRTSHKSARFLEPAYRILNDEGIQYYITDYPPDPTIADRFYVCYDLIF